MMRTTATEPTFSERQRQGLQIHIEEVIFDTTFRRILISSGLEWLYQICELSDATLMNLHDFGRVRLAAIREILAKYDLETGMEIPDSFLIAADFARMLTAAEEQRLCEPTSQLNLSAAAHQYLRAHRLEFMLQLCERSAAYLRYHWASSEIVMELSMAVRAEHLRLGMRLTRINRATIVRRIGQPIPLPSANALTPKRFTKTERKLRALSGRIADLDVSTKTIRCLESAGIEFVWELIDLLKTKERIHGIGQRRHEQIDNALAAKDLSRRTRIMSKMRDSLPTRE